MLKEVEGDLIKMALDGKFDVIVHGCNCMGNMGAGIAMQIKRTFPEVAYEDWSAYLENDIEIGNFTYWKYPRLTVVNAYTQIYPGKPSLNVLDGNFDSEDARYLYIEKSLKLIFEKFGGRIGLPLIGCGLAGLKWERVKKIIEGLSLNKNVDVTVVHYVEK